MPSEIDQCLEIVKALRPEAASAISSQSLDRLLTEFYEGDPKLGEAIKARSDQYNPRAPIYLFLYEIVTFCSVVYSIYDVIDKVDKITDIIADRNIQLSIVERAIKKLRKFGLSYPADKLERILDEVLDHLTRPQPSSTGQGEPPSAAT
ncbi:hypothetical protein X727_08380 [Mesorhizobium sp. L103C119B0]|uniref:hypothetical protein n=1 Tax=Mesorhizobium sp. L103C119B0 TaxID=1287085 RepID=UPI0003D0372A|nr:hypothetical protein [Mesorhizobium sp. L103C119B0]ESZ72454.1 hypothetical protein X727_08380 [Mesorhizobium sp. L103C119B0]